MLFAGLTGELPPCQGAQVCIIPVGEIAEASAASRRGTVLVLGDEAIAAVDPMRLPQAARPPRCIVLAVPGRVQRRFVVEWVRGTPVRVVRPGEVGRALQHAVRVPVRPEIPMCGWAPPGTGDAEARRLLELVPGLAELTVACWAREAGMGARTLLVRCRTYFGLPAKQVLWLYKDAVVARERRAGLKAEEVPASVGYANEANLRTAYRNRGIPYPRRSAGR